VIYKKKTCEREKERKGERQKSFSKKLLEKAFKFLCGQGDLHKT